MFRTIEIEIDEQGFIRPVDASAHLPKGRATLLLEVADQDLYRLSELSLSDWLRREEDEA